MKRSALVVGLTLDNRGHAVYEATTQRVPVRLRLRDGCVHSYYLISNRLVRADLLEQALRTGDLGILDAPMPRAKRLVNNRNKEMLAMLEQGSTYEAIGKHFGVTRQRAQHIAKRLRQHRTGLISARGALAVGTGR